MRNTRNSIPAVYPNRDHAPLDTIIQDAEQKLNLQQLLREVNRRFGVKRWHINEDELAAMWQLYRAAGSGIAIESSKANLESALKGDGIIVDQVRYMDFDRDEIEKCHSHYGLFIKRKSFAHEQELRATILLPKPGEGATVKYDMNLLIEKIRVPADGPRYYVQAVRYTVEHADIESNYPPAQPSAQPGALFM